MTQDTPRNKYNSETVEIKDKGKSSEATKILGEMQVKNTPKWGEDLKKEYRDMILGLGGADIDSIADWWIKKFSHLLSQRTEEIKKMVEGMRRKDEGIAKVLVLAESHNRGYNQALSDLLQAIDNLQ